MTALEKAHLEVLDKKGRVTESVPVQFNPATMSLQRSNSNDGGSARGRQTQQYNGSASTVLGFDLEYDTADEGTTERPVDVRSRTATVTRFVLPGGKQSKQAPPRVKFRWGTFELSGVMSSLTEELSLFASSGVPLRSKLTVQIKEQDSKFDALERGPGANPDSGPPAAGEPAPAGGAGPGTSGGGPADSSAAALAGETAADFLVRADLDPEAWRGLGSALDVLGEGIELEAGLSVEFDASLDVGLGVGVSVGFEAGIDASVGMRLGLEGTGATSARTGLQQGFQLTAAGGLTAATESARAAEAGAAADSARAGFGGPPAAPSSSAPPTRTPLVATSPVGGTPAMPAPPAPPPPRADPRSTTFGRGVPLRDRVGVPGAETAAYVVVGRPAAEPALTAARTTSSAGGDGCGCGCGHGCGGGCR